MVRHLVLGSMLAACWAQVTSAASVPFVGCPSDGQQGPQPAPKSGKTPDVAAHAAPKLAYYGSADGPAVLAPRGWHCFGTYGSNGSTLVVAPRPLDWNIVTGKTGISGPAIQLSGSSGSTSGRLEVAQIAARVFPAAKDFVDRIEREGILDAPLVRHPYPADRMTHRGPYEALYTTPAGREGLGTLSHLAVGALPIDGFVRLYPQGDMDLLHLSARLAAAQRPLVAEIIKGVVRN